MSLTILDYGGGNLKSVTNMLDALGYSYEVTNTKEGLLKAEKIIEQESKKIRESEVRRKSLEKEIEETQNSLASLTKDKKESQHIIHLRVGYQKILEEKSRLREKQASLKIQRIESMQRMQATVGRGARSIPSGLVDDIAKDLEKILELHKELVNNNLNTIDLNKIKQELDRVSDGLEKLFEKIKPYMSEVETAEQKKKRLADEKEFEEKIKKQQEEQKRKEKEITEIDEEIALTDKKAVEIQQELKQEESKGNEERQQIWQLQTLYQGKQSELHRIDSQISESRISIARLETKKDDVVIEMRQDLTEEVRSEVEELAKESDNIPKSILNDHEKRELLNRMGNIKHQLDVIGGIDEEVEVEYNEAKERWDFLEKEVGDLKQAMGTLEDLVKELNGIIKEQFKESFKIIDEEFQKYFKVLFNGGKARLVLLHQESNKIIKQENKNVGVSLMDAQDGEKLIDQVEQDGQSKIQGIRQRLAIDEYDGVEIEATPPGKKLKSINMLSGGERAMTSIALICSIISANPSPFVVLDEVDAALDEANSIRYAEIVNELSSKSQFIVITHNRATMEKADVLYGVTMGDDGVSKLLGLKLEDAREYTNR